MENRIVVEGAPQISSFEMRRRMRRVRMIVDVTTALLETDMSLSRREACSLVDCAERAISELVPSWRICFNNEVRPRLETIIHSRWPHSAAAHQMQPAELVN